ncbi:fluoride efflux transporter FluC [Fodinicola feengrottensis]|uniref:fluoride efflux transporter FluC n=1 Tax=Fodinicola feengrottensis TaxID=435914 RepID=UPI0028BE025B|nr:CrcB family protein [Fodinicola feengrottensis]
MCCRSPLPHQPTTGFPLATFIINALGCLLIGVLMVVVTEAFTVNRLVRPFLGVGVLGGFTTFSTYASDVVALADHAAVGVAVAYLVTTPLVAVAAAWCGVAVTRRVFGKSAG